MIQRDVIRFSVYGYSLYIWGGIVFGDLRVFEVQGVIFYLVRVLVKIFDQVEVSVMF